MTTEDKDRSNDLITEEGTDQRSQNRDLKRHDHITITEGMIAEITITEGMISNQRSQNRDLKGMIADHKTEISYKRHDRRSTIIEQRS